VFVLQAKDRKGGPLTWGKGCEPYDHVEDDELRLWLASRCLGYLPRSPYTARRIAWIRCQRPDGGLAGVWFTPYGREQRCRAIDAASRRRIAEGFEIWGCPAGNTKHLVEGLYGDYFAVVEGDWATEILATATRQSRGQWRVDDNVTGVSRPLMTKREARGILGTFL
jgi:hypothetical protein